MERLTQAGFDLCRTCGERAYCNHLCDHAFPVCVDKAIYDRLAAYEDTGLTPEEYKAHADALRKLDIEHMHDLLAAEQEGRLVVLPFRVRDYVYRVATRKKYIKRTLCTSYIKKVIIKPENVHKYINEIGKTVYLTREEAKAALEAQKGGEEK